MTSATRPRTSSGRINPTQEVDSTLTKAAERARERGIETVTEAREGHPADVLCDIAEALRRRRARGRKQGNAPQVLGSVPNSVSHKAPCSVVIVKTT